jgi:hypothetical protein
MQPINIGIQRELNRMHTLSKEYNDHLKALENNEGFQPKFIAKALRLPSLGKRKYSPLGRKKSVKRQRVSPGANEDESNVKAEDEETEDASNSDINTDSYNASWKLDSDFEEDSNSQNDSENKQVENEMNIEEQVTEESITAKIKEIKAKIRDLCVKQSIVVCLFLAILVESGTVLTIPAASQADESPW